jgi:predicted flap endonuclease-1-like 5' DNA nuclease
MTKIIDIEGIGATYTGKLFDIDIKTVEKLLREGSAPAGRKKISTKTGINESLILEWVNHADLFRIKGVGQEYADLLEEAGVDTVPELAQRNAEKLHATMTEINNKRQLVRHMPGVNQVRDWIKEAKKLPRVITYS